MLRKYLSDIAFIQILNLLVKPIWILVIDRQVQELLGSEVYGNYFAVFNFSLLFFIALDLGLTSYNITELSRDNKLTKKLAGNVLGIKTLLISVYLILLFFIGKLIGYGSTEFSILLWLALLQIITSFNQFFRSIVASWQKFKADGVFMVLDRVIVIALCAVLIWGNLPDFKLTIQNFIYAQIIALGTVFISLVIFVFPKIRGMKINFGLKRIMPMLRKSWPFALLISLMGMYNLLDGVMLKSLMGNSEAGEYAMGYRLFFAVLMFGQIFSGVLLPFFSKHNRDRQITRKVSKYTAFLLLWVGLGIAFVTFAFGEEIMEALYPTGSTLGSITAFRILMFGFIGSILTIVFGTLLTAHREMRLLNSAALFTLLLNVFMNLWLIPKHGSAGAATATVISQMCFGLICLTVSIRKFNFQMNWRKGLLQILAVVILYLAIVVGKQYLDNLVVHLVIVLIAAAISAYLFKLLEKKHILTLLKK